MTLAEFEREYVRRYVHQLADAGEVSEVQILIALKYAAKFGVYKSKTILKNKIEVGKHYKFSVGKSPNEILFEFWKADRDTFLAEQASLFYLLRSRAMQLLDSVKMARYKTETIDTE
jgi:hypothetical protein